MVETGDTVHCYCCGIGYRMRPGLHPKLCEDCYASGCSVAKTVRCKVTGVKDKSRKQSKAREKAWKEAWEKARKANW